MTNETELRDRMVPRAVATTRGRHSPLHVRSPFQVFLRGRNENPARGTVQKVESDPTLRAQHVKRSGKPQTGRKP